MKKILLITLIVFVVTVGIYALDGYENQKAGKTLQTTCPVMGGKVNKALFADVDGKRIYVCCPGCISTIKKNPAKYITMMEKKGIKLETISSKNKLDQSRCPVMGGRINKALYADVKGKRIFVCCPSCIKKVEENPENYLKKL